MRDRVEGPDQVPGAHVVRAHVARCRVVLLIRGRAENDQVFEDSPWRGGLHVDLRWIAPESLSEIHAAVHAKRRNGLARDGVNRLQKLAVRKEQTPLRSVLAFPVVDPACRHTSARILVDPDLFSCGGVEGDNRVVLRHYVHDAVHHDRVEQVVVGVSRRIGPRDLQRVHVGAVDLAERGILRAVGAASVVAPCGVRRFRRLRPRPLKDTDERADDEN